MRRISKTFAGTKALHGVDLAIYPGEVHALMGENGAGKSTLMKILAGACSADPGGEIWMDGQRIEISSPLAARRQDRKSTRLNSSHLVISYAVFCLKKKK